MQHLDQVPAIFSGRIKAPPPFSVLQFSHCHSESLVLRKRQQQRRGTCHSNRMAFVVFLVVFDGSNNNEPILVNDGRWARKAESRYPADKQMRDRYALIVLRPVRWGLTVVLSALPCASTVTNKATYEVTPFRLSCARDLRLASHRRVS